MPIGDGQHSGTWVTFVQGRPKSLSVRRCRLKVVAGPDAGRSFELAEHRIRIGARGEADVSLSDPKVSGVHCEIRLEPDGYRLRDLDSTNGTRVAGYRVFDLFIEAGTVLGLGDTELEFQPLAESLELPLAKEERFGGMVGGSPLTRRLFARLAKVAKTDATVLITGETGTGKDVAAEALHEQSARASGPFVVLDCGSIAPNLIESEIFGHERGAFTGATHAHAGAFERADGGTLFLDELGELPIDLQPKLLRVLERREVRRLGGAKSFKVDVRLIAATNRDLALEVNRGRFREDLYYRLAVAHLELPPLRDRPEDIPLLVEHFLEMLPGGSEARLRPETIEVMKQHPWPGNVRELRNVIERAVLLGEEPQGAPAAEPGAAQQEPERSAEHPPAAIDITVPFKKAKQTLIDDFERRYLTELLEEHAYNLSAAARSAGVDRMTLHKIADRLGIRTRTKSKKT